MKKLWLVASATYRRRVRSGTFLLLTFGLPAIMIVAGAIPILREVRGDLPEAGIVDLTGRLRKLDTAAFEEITLSLSHFPDMEAAMDAHQAGRIGAILLVPAGYFEGERPRLYVDGTPSAIFQEALASYLRAASQIDRPAWLLERFQDPSRLTYTALEGHATVSQGPDLLIRVLTPFALGMLFAFSIFTGANQLGAVVVREKDQRAMEMVITSIRPRTLVGGKVLGVTMVSLTQLAIWAAGAALALGLALSGSLRLSAGMIHGQAFLWAFVLGVPGFFLYATIAAGLGVIAGDQQHARQLAGMLGFVGMSPLYVMGLIVNEPNGPLAVALTVFPLTAPTFGLMRMTLTTVPTLELIVGAAAVIACLILGIIAVARIFRAAMLLYGQRLTPRQVWTAIRQSGR
jgi:ABC-2 type transport system permease protein